MSSSSFISTIMEPGGGVVLLPFVRGVIACLLALTVIAAILDVARIHMIVLSVLSGGLLLSLSFFESELKKMRRQRPASSATTNNTSTSTTDSANKTD